jgi:recombination protein RecA
MANKKLEAFFKSYSDAENALEYRMANEVLGEKVPVISTGSPALNDALSSGGLPRGRVIQYYGPPGSGKTLMAMIAIKEAQSDDPDALQMFIDAEGTFSPTWAEVLGVDTSRVIHVEDDMAVNGRRCFEMLLGVPKEDKQHILIGKSKEGFLDQIISKEINCNLIVLDSLGSIIPPGEDVSAVGKMNMSLLARFLTTTMRKLSLEIKKANIPFIIINHKKDSMDPYAAINHTFSGGNTYTHFLSANIYFEAIQRKDAQILDEKDQKIGHPLRAKIEKSKFGSWPRQCEFKVDFTRGIIDTHEEIAQLALDYGVVEKPNAMSYQYGETKWVGIAKFNDALASNQDLCNEISSKIEEARNAKLDKKRAEQKVSKINPTDDVEVDTSETKKRKAK